MTEIELEKIFIKTKYGVDSFSLDGCILVPLAMVQERLDKLDEIKKLVERSNIEVNSQARACLNEIKEILNG